MCCLNFLEKYFMFTLDKAALSSQSDSTKQLIKQTNEVPDITKITSKRRLLDDQKAEY